MTTLNDQNDDLDYGEFDRTNPFEKGTSQIPALTYINANSDYVGTPLERGGFRVNEGNMQRINNSTGRWQDMANKGQGSLVAPAIECAVIGASVFSRRFAVTSLDDKGDRIWMGHVDIDTKFWNSMGDMQAQYKDHEGKNPPRRVSLFVVLRESPDQIWELPLKSGNAGVLFDLQWQLNQLAGLQTKRIEGLAGRKMTNTLMPFINWVTLMPGVKVPYKQRLDGGDAGGFSRLSIGFPGIRNIYELQRPLMKSNEYGPFVDSHAEYFEAKKVMSADDITGMHVGKGLYGQFVKMYDDLQDRLMNGYIRPFASHGEIADAIELVKQRYFERSIAGNSRQLPPATPAPADDGPRNRDEWEDAKQSLAQSPSNGKPTKTEDKVPTLWNLAQLKEFKTGVIMGWADATEKEREVMVSHVTVQYLMRLDKPPEWKGEPDAKQVAKTIGNLITWDEVNAEEQGQVTY